MLRRSLIQLFLYFATCGSTRQTLTVWNHEFQFDDDSMNNSEAEISWLINNYDQIEAIYAYAAWKINCSFGEFSPSSAFQKLKNESSPIIKTAIETYQDGPNWIRNESIPEGYYRLCGYNKWLSILDIEGVICSIQYRFKSSIWSTGCMCYSVIHGQLRDFGKTSILALSNVLSQPILFIYTIFGVLNLIIITRVVKDLGVDGAASLRLHQIEIVCDILVVVREQIPLNFFVDSLYFAVTGFCFSPKARYSVEDIYIILFHVSQQFGQVVLALLAYDRLDAVKNPINYMAEISENKTRMRKCMAIAFVVVIGAVSLEYIGHILLVYGVITRITFKIFTALANLTQSLYLFACLIMVAYCSAGLLHGLRKMKNLGNLVSNEKVRMEALKRNTSLVLQTMVLNASALIIIILLSIEQMIYSVFDLIDPNIYKSKKIHSYLSELSGITYMNSNLGFIVHCIHSETYRSATRHVFKKTKQKMKILFCILCKKFKSHDQVTPFVQTG